MFQIVFTLLLLAMIVYGIMKKINITTVLMFATVCGYIGLLLLQKEYAAGDTTSGSHFLDIFESIGNSMKNSMGGYILTSISMLSYVDYMNRIKATDMFAALLAAPVQKLKYKYLIAAFTIPIGVLMGIAISGSLITITLLLGTIYPVLRSLGCSKPTCATAILLHTIIAISPVRSAYYNALSLMNMDISVAMWFIRVQLPVGGIMVAVVMVLFILTSRYFDRKEGLNKEEKESLKIKTVRDIGVPVYYAILPLLPLILVVIFSELVVGTVIISVVGACVLSWCIAFTVQMLSTRSLSSCLKNFEAIYEGMGVVMTTSGPIVIFGTTFSVVLTALGGMSLFIDTVSKVACGYVLLGVVGVTGLLMVSITGTFNGNLALVFPVVRGIVQGTGINPLGAAQAAMFSLTSGAGICLVSGQNLFLAQQTDTNILVIIKRSLIPTIGGFIASFLASVILFG